MKPNLEGLMTVPASCIPPSNAQVGQVYYNTNTREMCIYYTRWTPIKPRHEEKDIAPDEWECGYCRSLHPKTEYSCSCCGAPKGKVAK